MNSIFITEATFQRKLKRTTNFKNPGPDRLTNIWMRQFTWPHHLYINWYSNILNSNEEILQWMTLGWISLLPKSKADSEFPHVYRPICCLQTTLLGLVQDDRCRFWKEAVDSVSHLLSWCEVLLGNGGTLYGAIRYVEWFTGDSASTMASLQLSYLRSMDYRFSVKIIKENYHTTAAFQLLE